MPSTDKAKHGLTNQRILRTWWPLAAGWLMMTVEIPILAAVVARTGDPKIHLAAWGITFPLALIMGAPLIMMLGASTALCRDWDSYQKVRRYMFWISGIMTGLHLLLAFTPLYDLIVVGIIAAPAEIVEPARLGLQIMLPYALVLAYRRFNYGVLIRFGHAGAVTVGVATRLAADAVILTLLLWVWPAPGIVIATVTFTVGVIVEAVYSMFRVRSVVRNELRRAAPVEAPVTLSGFLEFYIPLVLTSLLQVIVQPLMSAGISRMPQTLDSLAVWPVVFGFLILWTSAGQAYLEVVVVLLDEPRSLERLRRFAGYMAGVSVGLLILMIVTPLAEVWFVQIAALPPALITMATVGLGFLLPMPAVRVFQSFYQGILLNVKQTRGVTESVVLDIVAIAIVLWVGVWWGQTTGLYVALLGALLGELIRIAWLRLRALPAMREREQAEGLADPQTIPERFGESMRP